MANRREGFLAAKEELDLVAVMNRPRLNTANQPFKPGVTNAQRQRLGEAAHILSAQFARQLATRSGTEHGGKPSASGTKSRERLPARGGFARGAGHSCSVVRHSRLGQAPDCGPNRPVQGRAPHSSRLNHAVFVELHSMTQLACLLSRLIVLWMIM